MSFHNLHIPCSNRIFKVNSISPCYLTISPLHHIPRPPSPPHEFVSMNSELTLDLWNLIIVWNLVSGRYRGVYFSTFSGVLQVFISFLIKWTIEEISCDSPVTCQTLQYKLLELK